MHGKDSVENREKQAAYYDEYVSRQANVGVNARHHSIINKMTENGLKSNQKVLEIGCGIGTFSGLLGKAIPDGSGLCMDLSPKSIETAARTHANIKNLTFQAANAVEHDFGQLTFDHIVLPDVIEHIPLDQHAKLFEKLAAILIPSGSIHIHIPNPPFLAWCHEHRPDLLQIIDQPVYTEDLLQHVRPSGLHLHKLETYSIWVEDGDYQYLVLKKDGYQDFTRIIEEKVTLLDKVKYKLNRGK